MHDDVGIKLARLSLLSTMATAAPGLPSGSAADVREISDTAWEVRHEVFLTAKETLTNVTKYAAASRVRLRLTLQVCAFELSIEDACHGKRRAGRCPP